MRLKSSCLFSANPQPLSSNSRSKVPLLALPASRGASWHLGKEVVFVQMERDLIIYTRTSEGNFLSTPPALNLKKVVFLFTHESKQEKQCRQTLSPYRKHKMCLVSIYKPTAQCEGIYIKQFGAFWLQCSSDHRATQHCLVLQRKSSKMFYAMREKICGLQSSRSHRLISFSFFHGLSWTKMKSRQMKTLLDC